MDLTAINFDMMVSRTVNERKARSVLIKTTGTKKQHFTPTGDGVEGSEEVHELNEMWSDFSRLVGDVSDKLTLDDSVGNNNASEAVAELTDVEIAAEVTRQQSGNAAAEIEVANSENIPPPTTSKAVAGLALAPGRLHISTCSAMPNSIRSVTMSSVRRQSFTAQQKLEIIAVTEKFGNREAGRRHDVDESCM
ncbi:hypothetical protein MTO96_051389 [Rhipicephalus appendiculatus]